MFFKVEQKQVENAVRAICAELPPFNEHRLAYNLMMTTGFQQKFYVVQTRSETKP